MTLRVSLASVVILCAPVFWTETFAQAARQLTEDCFKAESSNPQLVIKACSKVIDTLQYGPKVERALNRRGLAYERTGKFAEALRDFTTIIQKNNKGAGY